MKVALLAALTHLFCLMELFVPSPEIAGSAYGHRLQLGSTPVSEILLRPLVMRVSLKTEKSKIAFF